MRKAPGCGAGGFPSVLLALIADGVNWSVLLALDVAVSVDEHVAAERAVERSTHGLVDLGRAVGVDELVHGASVRDEVADRLALDVARDREVEAHQFSVPLG